jgi:hypothetical protein
LAGPASYTTTFARTEMPISEGRRWVNGAAVGLDWHDVQTTRGVAFGTNSPTNYTDPTALLTGDWGLDYTVTATVHSVKQNPAYFQEVELRLRSALSAHRCTGYEVNFRCLKTPDAYMQIVRWNGPVGDFTYLKSRGGAKFGVADGDVVKANIVGNVIKVYRNDTLLDTATDDTFKTGLPGMGFNANVGDSFGDFGFSKWSVTVIPSN